MSDQLGLSVWPAHLHTRLRNLHVTYTATRPGTTSSDDFIFAYRTLKIKLIAVCAGCDLREYRLPNTVCYTSCRLTLRRASRGFPLHATTSSEELLGAFLFAVVCCARRSRSANPRVLYHIHHYINKRSTR